MARAKQREDQGLQLHLSALMSSFVLPIGARNLTQVVAFLSALSPAKAWRVTVEESKKPRTNLQNKTIWGLAYETILRDGGEAMAGWDKEDLHRFFLGEWSGWEVVEIFGQKRQRPIKRSSKLTRAEFASYFDFIQRKAAEFGIFIPDPDPHWNDK